MKMDYAVTRTFSLTMRHVKMMVELSGSLGRSQAKLIREAIEDLAMKYELEASDTRVSQYIGKDGAAGHGDGASE